MNASPDGSDMFLSCVAEQSVTTNNSERQGFEATDIPQAQDSDASDSVQPLLTQAPAESQSSNEEDEDMDEFQSLSPQVEAESVVQNASTASPFTQEPRESERDGCGDELSESQTSTPTNGSSLILAGAGQYRHTAMNRSILSSSPESMAQSSKTHSAQDFMTGNGFWMTQPPTDSPSQENGDKGTSGDDYCEVFDTDAGDTPLSQPDSVLKAQESPSNSQSLENRVCGTADTTLLPESTLNISEDYDSSSDGSSTDDDEEERLNNGMYVMSRKERIKRNQLRMISLGFASPSTARTPVSTKATPVETHDEENVALIGMLLPPCNPTTELMQDNGSSTDIDDLYDRYPHRDSQIRMLVSFIGSTMGQTEHQGIDPYVPPPIFVSGPSGSGKTSVVRDVIETLRRHYLLHQNVSEGRVIGTAYVNCAATEPYSLEAVLENAYSQLIPQESLRRPRSKKKTKRKRKQEVDIGDAPQGKQLVFHARGTAKHVGTCFDPNEEEYNSDNEADMEDKIEESRTQVDTDENYPSVETRRMTRHSKSGMVDISRRNTDSKLPKAQGKTIRKTESVSKSHAAPVAFGRVLTSLFGPPSPLLPEKMPGSAFLILDHAERLFSMSTSQKPEPNNFLAQLLLVPQVMGLNLTLIIVSRSTLLDCSRINNSASVKKALGTIASGICPIRVHFSAYRGSAQFKSILKQPTNIELIVGKQSSSFGSKLANPQSSFQENTIDSFLETLVQSLSSVTRDVREMIRIGRALWPTYILPLHPSRIQATLDAARRRRSEKRRVESVLVQSSESDQNSSVEDLQKELLAILDEAILPRIKRCLEEELFIIKGDDIQHAVAVDGSSVADRSSSSRYDLPFLSKCLLLAAFVCQSNKPDKDKALLTIQKNGKKNSRQGHRTGANDVEGLAYGSTTWEQQRLKMLRPRTFSLERMLSVFVNIVGLIGGEEKLQLSTNSTADTRDVLSSIGSTCFFESLARLREIGLLHEVQGTPTGGGEGSMSFDGVNMISTKYWCELNRDDAEALAASVDFPLANFLL